MKGYLFGLGAMLVGAELMFVLMHGEVRADSKTEAPESFVCSDVTSAMQGKSQEALLWNCKVKNTTCVIFSGQWGNGDMSFQCLVDKGGLFN